jgi:hypothetical protein
VAQTHRIAGQIAYTSSAQTRLKVLAGVAKIDPRADAGDDCDRTPVATIPMGLRILAIVLRALFIGPLVVLMVRASSPRSESFASVYETLAI